MKIKQSFLYQLNDAKKSVIIYYIVMAAVLVLHTLTGVIDAIFYGGITISMSGLNFATAIFLFIFGLCFFKDNFGMLIQNGISRKTLFIGAIMSMAAIAVGMAIIDGILMLFTALVSLICGGSGEIISVLQGMLWEKLGNVSGVGMFFLDLTNSILANFMALTVGYIISLIYYRLSKTWKVLVSVGVPALLFIALPIIDGILFNFNVGIFSQGITLEIMNFFFTILAVPSLNLIAFFASAIVFSGCSYLLIQKAIIKQK